MSEWINHAGGKVELPLGTIYDARHRDGSISIGRKIQWQTDGIWNHLGTPCDIVAYRVTQHAPNVITHRIKP